MTLAPAVATHAVETTLLAAASQGLAGSLLTGPGDVLADEDFARVMAALGPGGVGDGLSGLLLEAMDSERVPVTPDQHDVLTRVHRRAMDEARQSERVLLELLRVRRDPPVCVLGELASGHLDYRRTSHRPYRGLHLLLVAPWYAELAAILESLGFRARGQPPRSDFIHRFGDNRRFVAPDRPDVFVHRTLVGGPYGVRVGMPPDPMGSALLSLEGQRLHVPNVEVRILYAAFRAVLTRAPTVTALRDLAQVVLFAPYDPKVLRALAREWRCEAVLARAVEQAWETLAIADVLALSRWASRYFVAEEESSLISLYRTRQSSYVSRAKATLHEVHGLGEKAAFISAIALPEQPFLQARQLSRTRWLLRGAKAVLRGRPGSDPEMNRTWS